MVNKILRPPFREVFSFDLVFSMDALGWASFCAFAAIGAFFRIDVCTVVSNGDCAELTGAFTFLTTQTAVSADFSGAKCVLFGTAGYPSLLSSWNDFQNILWANFGTSSTAYAQRIVDLSQIIFNADCIVWTSSNTVAITKTAIGASAVTCEEQLSSRAGLQAAVFILYAASVISLHLNA